MADVSLVVWWLLLALSQNPVNHKHFVKVTDLKFSPVHPHDLAACASSRVRRQRTDSQTIDQSYDIYRENTILLDSPAMMIHYLHFGLISGLIHETA